MFNFIIWDINPEIFSVGQFSIRWYGLLFALGFLIGQRIMAHIYISEGLKESLVDSLLLTMVASTVVGARLGHFAFYEPQVFLTNPLQIITPPFAGLASHGATIGILLALYFYGKFQKMSFLWIVDRIVITVAFAGFCIRMGNLMNSEIVGKVTNVPWAFVFKSLTEYGIESQFPRHPAQLYEALSCLVLCFLLYGIWKKYKTQTPQGLLLGIFLIWVFGLRFVWEFFKEPQVAFERDMTFNMGQLLSIPAILLGIFYVWYAYRYKATRIFTDKTVAEQHQS